MKLLLQQAGRASLKAFVLTFLTFSVGLVGATNLDEFKSLGVAALVASFVAVFAAVKELVPQVTFAQFLPQPYASWLDAFTIAGLGTFLVLVQGVSEAPDYETGKAVVLGAFIGALQAGFRALEGLFTKGETPVESKGFGPGG